MDAMLSGEVVGRQVSVSPRLRRKIAAGLAEWVNELPISFREDRTYYLVSFDRDAERGVREVECKLEIVGSLKVWSGSKRALDPYVAFNHCLQSIVPNLETGCE